LRYTFSKNERLCSQLLIDALMQRTNPSFLNFPFIFTWKEHKLFPGVKAQILISVSKKKFKHAVDRNHMKRLMREAYRLNKHLLYDKLGTKQLIIHINYIAPKILDFHSVQGTMINGLIRIANDINKA
jgi:ribonuclease P protein component